ncbi:MAG: M56 family metallopeptidase [Clostridia bacterium]
MINSLNDLIIICVTANSFFLLTILIKPITQKLFSESWHYNMSKFNIVLFIIPIYSLTRKAIEIFSLPTFENYQQIENFREIVVNDFSRNEIISIASQSSGTRLEQVLMVIWIIGIIISLIWKLYCVTRMKKEIYKSCKVNNDNIYKVLDKCKDAQGISKNIELLNSESIYSPMLIGLIKIKIVLTTASIDEEYLKLVFTHELIHYKRKDLWWKALMLVITTVFWFNPFVYLVNNYFEKVLELSCDEKVVNKLCLADRKKYGLAILESLNSSKKMNKTYGVCLNTPKQKLERRLDKMIKFVSMKKTTKIFSVALGLTLMSTVLVPAFANAQEIKTDDEINVNWGTNVKSEVSDGGIITYDFKTELDTTDSLIPNQSLENVEDWITKIENGDIKPNSLEHIKDVEAVASNLPKDAQIVSVHEYYLDEEGNSISFDGKIE